MSSFEQLFFRLTFSILILMLMTTYQRKLRFARRADILFFGAIGFTYAFFALSGLSALAFDVPIAVSVALIYTQPIFTAVISFATRKEKVTIASTAVVLLGVAGAFLVSGLSATNQQINWAIAFPVAAGLFYAIYLWLKRQAPTDEYSPLQVLLNTLLFAVPVLLTAWVILGNLSTERLLVGVVTPDLRQLTLLFFFALISTVLPYSLLNYVHVKEVSPTSEGLLLLGDPLLHTLWAMLFFGEHISTTQYAGAAVILASAALNLRLARKNRG